MKTKLWFIVLFLILGGSASFAQDAYYSETAVAPNPWVRQGGLLPSANTAVRICTFSATPTVPCTGLATVWDMSGNVVSTALYQSFGQISTDILGRYTFGCSAGKYTLQIQSTTNNSILVNKPISCGGTGGGGLADPGSNGVLTRTAFNTTGLAGFTNIVNLWASGSCIGFLKNDGTCSTVTGGIADPGSNGVMKRTALNTSAVAVFGDIVNLWTSCVSGFLKFDGTCASVTSGLADPGANGVIKRTALNTTAAAGFADVVALWTTCTGFLKNDGTCAASGATPAGSSGNLQYNNAGSFGGFGTTIAGSAITFPGPVTAGGTTDQGLEIVGCSSGCTVSGATNFKLESQSNLPMISVNTGAYVQLATLPDILVTTIQGNGVDAVPSSKRVKFAAGANISISTATDTITITGTGAGTPASFYQIGRGQSGNSYGTAANQIRVTSFSIPYSVTATKILYKVTVIDAVGANKYDVGIYDNTGALKANIGPTSFTVLGYFQPTITQTTVTLSPGLYYWAMTGAANTAAIEGGPGSSCIDFVSNSASATGSSGGTLPASITIPGGGSYVTNAEGLCGHLALTN